MKLRSGRIAALSAILACSVGSVLIFGGSGVGGDSLLTGSLTADLVYQGTGGGEVYPPILLQSGSATRSVALAGALSAVMPGAGQAYNRSWIKMAIAVGIEAALVSGYFVWRARGHDGEEEFRAYAHQYWSPIRYAQWLNGYTGYNGPDIPMPSLSESDFQMPSTWTVSEAAAVRAFFNEIRAAEEDSYHIETGAAFSHVLPYFGEQQYYELIGKYFQYAPGWSDYNGANDPEQSGPNGEKVNVPPGSRFFVYDEMHEKANNLLRRASRVSGLIIVNHFLAVIDAAVTAKLHNNRVSSEMAVVAYGEGRLGFAALITVGL